jgi:hypothetical protein
MTNKECIDRWSEYIIPAVFKAEEALQKAVPEWKERLRRLSDVASEEDPHKVAKEYCTEIATIIVTQGSDYVPDGTIDGEADYISWFSHENSIEVYTDNVEFKNKEL